MNASIKVDCKLNMRQYCHIVVMWHQKKKKNANAAFGNCKVLFLKTV